MRSQIQPALGGDNGDAAKFNAVLRAKRNSSSAIAGAQRHGAAASGERESEHRRALCGVAKSAQRFYARYLLEQLRLAATFSSQSSEIDTLTPSEMTGNELLDGEFCSPSTMALRPGTATPPVPR